MIPLHNVLKQNLDKNGLTEVAQIEFNCIPVTVEVAQTGLPFNTEAAKDKIASLDTEINIVSGKLNEIVLKSGWQSLLNPRNRKHSILQVLNIC